MSPTPQWLCDNINLANLASFIHSGWTIQFSFQIIDLIIDYCGLLKFQTFRGSISLGPRIAHFRQLRHSLKLIEVIKKKYFRRWPLANIDVPHFSIFYQICLVLIFLLQATWTGNNQWVQWGLTDLHTW
jgi:hypothetical protein